MEPDEKLPMDCFIRNILIEIQKSMTIRKLIVFLSESDSQALKKFKIY